MLVHIQISLIHSQHPRRIWLQNSIKEHHVKLRNPWATRRSVQCSSPKSTSTEKSQFWNTMALDCSNCVCLLLEHAVFSYAVVYAMWREINMGLEEVETCTLLVLCGDPMAGKNTHCYSPCPDINGPSPRFVEVGFWTSVCNRGYFTTAWYQDIYQIVHQVLLAYLTGTKISQLSIEHQRQWLVITRRILIR